MKCVSEALLELLCLLTSIEKAASYVGHEALINASQVLRRKSELLFPDIVAIGNGQKYWYETFD